MKRLLDAARSSGIERPVPVCRVLPDGTCELTARSERTDDVHSDANEWDRVLGLD